MGPFCYIKCYRFPFTFQAVELFTHEQATQNPIIGRTVVGGVQMLSFNMTKIPSKWAAWDIFRKRCKGAPPNNVTLYFMKSLFMGLKNVC